MCLSWLKNGFTLSHISWLFATSGVITIVSQLYLGSISDKEIVAKSGNLNDDLWGGGDSVMADQGFLIHEELEKIGVSVHHF